MDVWKWVKTFVQYFITCIQLWKSCNRLLEVDRPRLSENTWFQLGICDVRAPIAKYAVLGSRLPLSGLPLQGVTQDFCDDRNSGIGCPFVSPLGFPFVPLWFSICTTNLTCVPPKFQLDWHVCSISLLKYVSLFCPISAYHMKST